MILLLCISSIHYYKIAYRNYTLFMDIHCICALYIICKQNRVSIVYSLSCTILCLLQEMSLWVWNAKLGLIILCMIGVIELDLFNSSYWLISQVSYYWTILQHPLNCNNAARIFQQAFLIHCCTWVKKCIERPDRKTNPFNKVRMEVLILMRKYSNFRLLIFDLYIYQYLLNYIFLITILVTF